MKASVLEDKIDSILMARASNELERITCQWFSERCSVLATVVKMKGLDRKKERKSPFGA